MWEEKWIFLLSVQSNPKGCWTGLSDVQNAFLDFWTLFDQLPHVGIFALPNFLTENEFSSYCVKGAAAHACPYGGFEPVFSRNGFLDMNKEIVIGVNLCAALGLFECGGIEIGLPLHKREFPPDNEGLNGGVITERGI